MMIRHKYTWDEFPHSNKMLRLSILHHLYKAAAKQIIDKSIVREIAMDLRKIKHR